MAGLTEEEAHGMLQGSSKYLHSVLVSRIMAVVAGKLNADRRLWALTGLLHDVDYEKTRGDPRRHGVAAAEWLQGRLPAPALHAIRSHDHETGMKPTTRLDKGLVFADSLAILIEDQRLKAPYTTQAFFDALRVECEKRPYLGENILRFAEREGLAVPDVINEMSKPAAAGQP